MCKYFFQVFALKLKKCSITLMMEQEILSSEKDLIWYITDSSSMIYISHFLRLRIQDKPVHFQSWTTQAKTPPVHGGAGSGITVFCEANGSRWVKLVFPQSKSHLEFLFKATFRPSAVKTQVFPLFFFFTKAHLFWLWLFMRQLVSRRKKFDFFSSTPSPVSQCGCQAYFPAI